MPYIGRSTDGFGVRNRFIYLASSGDTSVSGADANGATLTFTDGAYVDVYLNGVLLKPTTDYNTSTANTIAGLSALNTNDEVTVVVYDVFTVADMVSATSGGTFNGAVTLSGGITGDVSIGDDLTLGSDSAVLNFGADNDVTLTHEADAGLLMNTTLRDTRASFGVYNNSNGNVSFSTDDTVTTITFNTTDFDVGSNVKSGNNSIFVAPVAGTYHVTARILVQGLNSSTYYNVTMYLATRPSGSSTISYPFNTNRRANFYTAAQTMQLTGLVSVAAGTDIFIRAAFPSVANLVYYASQAACNFFVTYVGNRNSGGT